MCSHCLTVMPDLGFCCERAELDALRSVTAEVAHILDSEIVSAQSIGASDVVDTIQYASKRLQQVLAA